MLPMLFSRITAHSIRLPFFLRPLGVRIVEVSRDGDTPSVASSGEAIASRCAIEQHRAAVGR
jgi:hypothetical protein